MGLKTYSKLYYSCVIPVLDYCSGPGVSKVLIKVMIQNGGIRYIMGVHRFTPILENTGDMGWAVSTSRRWANVLCLWNRLVNMDENRLAKRFSIMIILWVVVKSQMFKQTYRK